MIVGMMLLVRLTFAISFCLAMPLASQASDVTKSSRSVDAEAMDAVGSESRLDTLFTALAGARSEGEANSLAGRINRELVHSESATISLLMERAIMAINARDYPLALDLLDSVILLSPNYVEAWNKRATVYFLQDELNLALNDIEQTLRLEPRHYGALLGFGMIMQKFDEKAVALKVFRKVLEIYPHNSTAQQRVDSLSKEVEGVPL